MLHFKVQKEENNMLYSGERLEFSNATLRGAERRKYMVYSGGEIPLVVDVATSLALHRNHHIPFVSVEPLAAQVFVILFLR